MFPVGHLMKQEVRTIAHKVGMPSAHRRDSQGICFLGKVNYVDFLRRYIEKRKERSLNWKRAGYSETQRFLVSTIGQRKGLGLEPGPVFVVKKDTDENVIYVSNGYDPLTQYGDEIRLADFNFISGNPWQDLTTPVRISFKIRHTPDFTTGSIRREGNHLVISSDVPVAGIAAGQFGVLYVKPTPFASEVV
jgi:tRNA-specific 2-thiouridylase